MTASQAALTLGNGQIPAEIGLRNAVQLQGDFGDDSERALRADEETGEIVAGRALSRAARGLDDLAVGHDHGEAKDRILHGAVANRIGAGGARCRHPADGSVSTGIDGKEQPLVAQVLVQLLAGDPCLDGAVEILLVDRQDAFHQAQIDRDASRRGIHVSFEGRAGPERNDRDAWAAQSLTMSETSSVVRG